MNKALFIMSLLLLFSCSEVETPPPSAIIDDLVNQANEANEAQQAEKCQFLRDVIAIQNSWSTTDYSDMMSPECED